MTYKINGTTLTAQPTSGRWLERKELGISGSGHIIYPAIREFVFQWGVLSPVEFNQLYNFYLQVGTTGTVVVDLPQYGASSYTFFSYSGCTLSEPETGEYFAGYYTNVSMTVRNIRV